MNSSPENWALLGTVASEGGPYLVVDVVHAPDWSGVSEDDYDGLCLELGTAAPKSGVVTRRHSHVAVAWDPGGGGIAEILRSPSAFGLLRWWGDGTATPGTRGMTLRARETEYIGDLPLYSGRVLVLWAPEDGRCIDTANNGPVPGSQLSIDGTAYILACAPGVYRVEHHRLELGDEFGVRCWFERKL